MKKRAGSNEDWPAQQRYWHALPDGWENLDYNDFLAQRRKLIADVIHDGFNKIGLGSTPLAGQPSSEEVITLDAAADPEDVTIASLADLGILRPGDNLDPVDGAEQDAAVTEDLTLRITDADGRFEEFDTLDAAARHLGFSNISGVDFWVRDDDPGSTISELLQQDQSLPPCR